MTKYISKYLLLIFIFIFLSCQENQNKSNDTFLEKNTITTQRIERINDLKSKTDSINKILDWKKVKDNLWINKNGELGIKTIVVNEEGVDIEKYITKLCCEGKSLKSVLDTVSFEFLGSSFYKDKNNIYTHYLMSGGGNFWIVKEADVSTFEIIGDCYAKDKNHIFGERAMVMDSVDYQTFKTKIGIGCFAKDKNGFYFWDEKINLSELNDSVIKNTIIELEKL